MAATKDDVTKTTVLYDVDFDPKNIIKAASTLERVMSGRFKKIAKSEEGVNKSLNKYLTRVGLAKKVVSPVLKAQLKQYQDIQRAIRINNVEIKKYSAFLKEAKANQAETGVDNSKEIEKATKKLRAAESGGKDLSGVLKKNQAVQTKVREQLEIPPDLFAQAAREAGEELLQPFVAFMKKDLPGFMSSSVGLAAKGFKGFKKMGTLDTKSSDMGGMLKAVSGMSKAMGPLLNLFSKFGPILGLASSAIMGLLKLFVDTEAAAKDFNRQILSTASTSDILGRNMGSVTAATTELETTLSSARAGAMAWSNVQWGISKEVAGAFTSAVTAEGVTLRQLGGDTDDAAAQTKEFTRVTQQAVAYSRAYGVSLNEVAQLQGEWQSEVGMGAKSIQVAYQTIAQGAADAGIVANKFFGIIRSFSADLTLFTLRLADVTKVMTVLGQSMNPRDAQKFMQTLTQKFKGGDILDNVRHVVVGGTETSSKNAKADIAARIPSLIEEVKKLVGAEGSAELATILNDPKRDANAIAKWQVAQEAKLGKKLTGPLMSNVQDVALATELVAKGGAFNTAAVLDLQSPLAKYEQLQRESVKVAGARLENVSGEGFAALQNAGVATLEEIRGARKFEQGLLTLQEREIAAVQTDTKTRTAVEARYGLKLVGTVEEQSNQLRELFKTEEGRAKFFHGLSKSDQDALADSGALVDYQKKIAGLQTSVLDRMGIIIDILMNKIYEVMVGIWDTIASMNVFGGDEAKLEVRAAKLRDPAAMEAVKSAGGDTWKARTNLVETSGKSLIKDIQAGIAKHAELKGSLQKAKDAGDTDAEVGIKDAMKQLEPLLEYRGMTTADIYTAMKLKFPGDHRDISTKGVYSEDAKKLGERSAGSVVKVQRDPLEVVDALNTLTDVVRKAGVHGAGGGVPAGGGPPPAVHAQVDAPPDTLKAQEATTKSVAQVGQTLKDGVALSKPTSAYKDAVKGTTLEALRTGLFEYYMYSGLDRKQVATGLRSGAFTGQTLGQHVLGGATAEGLPPETTFSRLIAPQAAPKAGGGIVTSIVNGKANTMSLPPGEGWTPIGRGESIIPAGGRGGGGGSTRIELELKGDLRRFVDARVVDGTANFERNKRLR